MSNMSSDKDYSCFYKTISLLSKNELLILLKETTSLIAKNMFRIKTCNTNIGEILEKHYSETQNIELFNTNFEDIEMLEYVLDDYFEKYKLIKQFIGKARLLNYKIHENTSYSNIPEDLVKIGCKRILRNQ